MLDLLFWILDTWLGSLAAWTSSVGRDPRGRRVSALARGLFPARKPPPRWANRGEWPFWVFLDDRYRRCRWLYLRFRQRSLQKLKRYPLNVILAIWPPDRIGNDCNCKLLTIWKPMRFLSSCHASQRYLRFRVNVMAVGDRASDWSGNM